MDLTSIAQVGDAGQYGPRHNGVTCEKLRELIAGWMRHAPPGEAARFWDLITCLRGPDSPSERPDMSPSEASVAYSKRRQRKHETVEVIRQKAFYGVIGGAARHHDGDHITLPPRSQWDHFDKHCERAARVLGLKVVIKGENNGE